MVNEFLKALKEMGVSQEEALEIVKKSKEAESSESEEEEGSEEEEEEEDSEGTEEKEDKTKQVDIDITKLTADITKSVSGTVKKVVSKEIKEHIKKLRGNPPKGEESEDFLGNNPFVKKNLFERRV